MVFEEGSKVRTVNSDLFFGIITLLKYFSYMRGSLLVIDLITIGTSNVDFAVTVLCYNIPGNAGS